MNNPNTKLQNLIYKKNKVIPSKICDLVIDEIKNELWKTHTWYDPNKNTFISENDKELSTLSCSSFLQDLLTPYINDCIVEYNKKYSFSECERTKFIINKLSKLRFNKYESNQLMRQHMDHIHSLFDGNEKGIPVLSLVLNFNENYSGGELYFWKNYNIKLTKGDIVIFPSCFLFPHGVKEIKSGTRYSAVCWGW